MTPGTTGQCLSQELGLRITRSAWISDRNAIIARRRWSTSSAKSPQGCRSSTPRFVRQRKIRVGVNLFGAGGSRQLPRPTYLICYNDQGIPDQLQRRMITKIAKVGSRERLVWRCDAEHNPATSQPETVCQALRKFAGEDVGSKPDVEVVEES